MPRLLIATAGAVVAGLLFAAPPAANAGSDPLDRPARISPLAPRALVTGIASAGERLVAVGQRGHVLVSADSGATWAQSEVPVSSDLTAVQFVDARVGHAVGHDGVVLRSEDGGQSWKRVLDGRQANRLLVDYMQERVAADPSDANQALLDEAKRNAGLGPDKPFLDVWFDSPDEGFVVGAYNLIFHTADGGRSWQPWFDRTDNPRLFNLYAIRPVGETLVIAGEGGLLLRLSAEQQRFVALPSPYEGSWFGLVATQDNLLAFGMRGNAWLSTDRGDTWQQVDSGLHASITTGVRTEDGEVWLADQSGAVARSTDGGHGFHAQPLAAALPAAALALQGQAIVLGGPRGLQRFDREKAR
ncbi:WD40/YVTN/BNR-like repeat-containing protein [Pseudoxanthomonas sangjuensis]|uniref:WD40/YVTN/BNR-like repeat-containing protein n=1 Tax=Pseudoxanthomonas sangjuensis TaxID=1503750 RepID=UPI001B8850FF|nr:YCF48-related protein [Pseudoxanthomonas sangjuensis]